MDYQTPTTYVCAVSVATVWTSPESPREIDAPGLENPVKLNKWLEQLPFEPRLDLCDGNRIQTQLLYGEHVLVEEINGDWAKIIALWQPSKKDERGYPGWVPAAQLKEVELSTDYGYAKVTSGRAQLFANDKTPLMVLPLNTILPVLSEDETFTAVQTPDGEALLYNDDVEKAPSLEAFRKGDGLDVIVSASKYLDLPYFWGGMSTYGYDCSGLSYNMLKAHGYFIPRDAGDQARGGIEIPVEDPSSWNYGDLLFFAYEEGKGKLHHVGIYYGNGQMIHSPHTGKSVEIINLKGTVYEKELCAVRRYVNNEGAIA